jgi:hypothetical protein
VQLVRLELQTQVAVDFIEAVATEEPLEMPCSPAVVAASIRMERRFSEDTVKSGRQPVLDVVVEERDLGWSNAPLSLAACGLPPGARFNPSHDLAQLDTSGSLVPASAAPVPAVAVAPLVQEYRLPLAICAESQTERECAVGLDFAVKRPRRLRRHQTPTARLWLRCLCIGTCFLLSRVEGVHAARQPCYGSIVVCLCGGRLGAVPAT